MDKKTNIKFVFLSRMKSDKKGFLLADETLKIIIGVICIALLVYLLVSIYNNKAGGEKKLLAKGVLDRTAEIISALGDGKTSTQDLVNPEGWYFMSFVGNQAKPNSCLSKNCVCICDDAWDYKEKFNRQQKKCDDSGECLIIENLRASQFKIQIEGTDNLKFIRIKKDNGIISIEG
jgi:hypothetical protein